MIKVFILSIAFPYGKSEPFLKDEMSFYDDAIVVSSYIGDIEQVELNVLDNYNFKLWHPETRFFKGNKLVMSISAILSVFFPIFWKELFSDGIKPINWKKIMQLMSCISKARQISAYVRKNVEKEGMIKNGDKPIFYAYWMNQLALASVILAKKYNGISISRCHGYDLYKRNENNQYVTFQKYLTKKLDYIFPISENGKQTLIHQFPKNADIEKKITVSRLGTWDYGISKGEKDSTIFTIVSCSNVVPLKRVHLIYDSIRNIDEFSVRWIHFGDGPLLTDLKEKVTKDKPVHDIQLKGYTNKDEIMEFYSKTYVDLFINVSESEGIPVSIMEAQSFGIPCMGTNVGGMREIIEDGHNGWLIDKSSSSKDIKKLICKIYGMNRKKYEEIRREARKYWESKYSAQKNYQRFLEFVGEIGNEL